MTLASQLQDIQITPGVMPSTDATNYDIPCWSITDKVRFDPATGRIRKIGGWVSSSFNYGQSVQGTMRTIYSATINNKVYTIIGTESYLYSLIGSSLTNITPLQTTSVAIPASLSTHYGTLANNPLTTVLGSRSIVVSDTGSSRYKTGDTYTLSGSSTTNGIPNTEINAPHIIRALGINTVTISVATAATSSGAGGGASVVRSDGLINVSAPAHSQANGDRVKISGSAATGGITAPQINLEFIIRNAAAGDFDVMTAGTSTSSVTGGGGAGVVYFKQIPAGPVNQGQGQGYGAGLYGVGLYGTALTSDSGTTYPRIWFIDRYGDNLIMTDGNSSVAYNWDGSNAVAPAPVLNAPTDINYAFVSDNVLVTFGHDVENEIFASDQGDETQWTASATNSVFQDIIEGSGRFISHVPVDGYNLIFTEQQTWTFKFIGGSLIWQTLLLDAQIGLIAPMARVSINGYAYWMGQDNFYMYRGGKIETIPSNFGPQSSILRYVFDNLNYSQRFKIFAWYNEKYDEIWFHYPSSQSNECDSVARVSRKLFAWMPDTLDRTAGEYPIISLSNPRLGNVGTLYTHESGNDADGLPLEWSALTKKFPTGTNTALAVNIIPDNTNTGTLDCTLNMYNYPQSAIAMSNKAFTVLPTTEIVPIQSNGRFWELEISGDDLGQSFLMGQWQTDQQQAARAK